MALAAANPACSQSELADKAGITEPSLAGILADLEQRGLLTRQRDEADKRRKLLVLTQAGQEMMAGLFTAVSPIEAPIRAALGEEDMARLTSLLDRALAALAAGEKS